MILASLAASLWSISGISGEILFKKYNFSSDWLVSTRTLISGILLFLIVIFVEKKSVLKPLKNKRDTLGIILFGLAGMYFVQYTYFRTIELSNVSFATILQFTAPFFIFIYESVKNKKIPEISTLILLFMTVLGVVFIATKGKVSSLSVPSGSTIYWSFFSNYDRLLLNLSKKTIKKIWKYNSSWMGNDYRKYSFKHCSSNLENRRKCKHKIYNSSSNSRNFRNFYRLFNLYRKFKLHFLITCRDIDSLRASTCGNIISNNF